MRPTRLEALAIFGAWLVFLLLPQGAQAWGGGHGGGGHKTLICISKPDGTQKEIKVSPKGLYWHMKKHRHRVVKGPCPDDNGGLCEDPDACNDENPCTINTCDPEQGCQEAPAPQGTACDDLNSCTENDVCNGVDGGCAGTPPPGLSCCVVDADCPSDACQPLICNSAGKCVNGPPTVCTVPNGVTCALPTCDPEDGCGYDQVSCDDGDLCTTDGCIANACVGGGDICANDFDAMKMRGRAVARSCAPSSCNTRVSCSGVQVVNRLLLFAPEALVPNQFGNAGPSVLSRRFEERLLQVGGALRIIGRVAFD